MNTDPRLLVFARRMRHEPAPAEQLLWKLLRNRRLSGFRFRRQHPVPPYIADFYCSVAKLVIELDGDTHAESQEYDAVREAFLKTKGLRVLRFWNADLYEDEASVLENVYQACVEAVKSNPLVQHKLDQWGTFSS